VNHSRDTDPQLTGSYRVAVIGSGPSGLYAAESLAERGGDHVQVDVIDRLPTPFGLVRYGVAPDHLKIKSILNTLHSIFDRTNVRFLGRLDLGKDVTAAELLAHYHAVVYATGAQSDRRLGVAGEHLDGSHSATEFVNWYNGHPLGGQIFDLSAVESVAVIGAGNVALDVARLLAKHPDELRHTDVPDDVLDVLSKSAVRDIHIVVRRGPVHVKFTAKELREFGELDHATVHVEPDDVPAPDAEPADLSRAERSNLSIIRGWADSPRPAATRAIRLRFWRTPSEILGEDSVSGIRLRDVSPAGGEGSEEQLPVQLVIRAIGYRSVPLPGVPFDDDASIVPNEAGRVLDEAGQARPREYVTGWLKRGPTGVIGTNRSDAEETITSLLADLPGIDVEVGEPIDSLLAAKKLPYTEFEGWLRIDAAERLAGPARGGSRVKIVDWDMLVQIAEGTGVVPD
jgi:ferredoxin--NADP+ reductase